MGKGLRSNRKKAIRRWRREIFLEKSSSLKKSEEKKQQILQRILAGPKIESRTEKDTNAQKRSNRVERRGRLGPEDNDEEGMDEERMEEDKRPAINITLVNAMKRQKKRLRRLRRNSTSHAFVVTECERKQILKQRASEDMTKKIENTLGLNRGNDVCSVQESNGMEICSQNQNRRRHQMQKRKQPPGSQSMRIQKIARGGRSGKRRVMARYRMSLKGITQYYPLKKEEASVDG